MLPTGLVVVSSMHTRGGSSSFLYFAAAARDDVGSAGQEPGRMRQRLAAYTRRELTYFYCNPYRGRGLTTVLVIQYYSLPLTTFTNIARDHIPTTSTQQHTTPKQPSLRFSPPSISTALSPITRPSFAYQLHATTHTRHSQDE